MDYLARPTSTHSLQPGYSKSSKYGSSSRSTGSGTIIEERENVDSGRVKRQYVKGKFLGKGGFAKVYEMQDTASGRTYAGKIIEKKNLQSSKAKRKLLNEIKIHKSLDHDNIVKFEHYFEDKNAVYILLEICKNQTMMELVKRRKRLTETEARYYMWQLMQSVKYMHGNNVIHRDLKLGNMFLNENMVIKVGDYGLAATVEYTGEKKKTICGTPNYIAPEILDGKQGHGFEVDIWSSGVVLYTLLIGKPPFETSDVKTTYRRIRTNTYSFPPDVPISDVSKRLIRRMLSLLPTTRPSVQEVLNDEFFTSGMIPKSLPTSSMHLAPSFTELQRANAVEDTAASNKENVEQTQSTNTFGSGARAPFANLNAQTGGTAGAGCSSRPFNLLSRPQSTTTDTSSRPRASTYTAGSTRPKVSKEKDDLTQLHDQLAQSCKKMNEVLGLNSDTKSVSPAEPQSGEEGLSVFVTKWSDFSSKYGLAFKLNNGAIGAHFNDSTKIMLHPDGSTVEYYDRVSGPTGSQDVRSTFQLEAYPENLKKKITLLKYFNNYLGDSRNEAKADGKVPVQCGLGSEASGPMPSPTVYVKRWMNTNHAFIFRLSNKAVQVNFYDHTELIVSSESRMVCFTSQAGERSVFSLSSMVDSPNPEVARRLRYTRDVLANVISRGKP